MSNFPAEEIRYVVGIDLGTTNSVVAYIDLKEPSPRHISILDIPQLIAPEKMGRRSVLPSFLYLPGLYELPPGSTALPWDRDRDYIVGEFAREQGARVPGRLVSSAKSWLAHGGVDRTAAILPWGAGGNGRKVSPVEAGARYLQHMREAWNESLGRQEGCRLEEQIVVLTVPASFDEVARELTVKAATQGELPRVVLLEEPLAAFYAWLSRHERDWQESMEEAPPISRSWRCGGVKKGCVSTGWPWENI
jgi:molecular chaperone DnaK (HSP70)